MDPDCFVPKYHYLSKNILGDDPVLAFKFCMELQKWWDQHLSTDPELAMSMDKWKKSKVIHLVWVSKSFSKEGPDEASETYHQLSKLYDQMSQNPDQEFCATSMQNGTDAENDRASERQIKQHLSAFFTVTKNEPLSEETIKEAHRRLMKGLKGDGKDIAAGDYRQIPMNADGTDFIAHSKVPSSMKALVAQYNEKFEYREHNPFELAGWLLKRMLDIHPFEDGNGRISRLLWCYSLLRDGLPFPVIPFPGIKKAYPQYINCIRRDRNGPDKHLPTLTLVSVTKTWNNFISNLRPEHPEKHQEIIEWLKEKEILLTGLIAES